MTLKRNFTGNFKATPLYTVEDPKARRQEAESMHCTVCQSPVRTQVTELQGPRPGGTSQNQFCLCFNAEHNLIQTMCVSAKGSVRHSPFSVPTGPCVKWHYILHITEGHLLTLYVTLDYF